MASKTWKNRQKVVQRAYKRRIFAICVNGRIIGRLVEAPKLPYIIEAAGKTMATLGAVLARREDT